MKFFCASRLFGVALVAVGTVAASPAPSSIPTGVDAVLPTVRAFAHRPGQWMVPAVLRVCITQAGQPVAADAPLAYALERFAARSAAQHAPVITYTCEAPHIRIRTHTSSALVPTLGTPEQYSLSVQDSGVTLEADNRFGALHGLQTLEALLTHTDTAAAVQAVSIQDAPRFAWRGLLLDTARTFVPVPIVLRTLDAMAAVKLNVLHWHLTDDQGFRIESKRFPRLHTHGSDGEFYRQDDVRTIVAHAARLGIRVVPEFDVPGHTASWLVAHPELAFGQAPTTLPKQWGILSDTLDPTREETYEFLHAFLGEMAELFPDEYVHLGGDEVDLSRWQADAAMQRWRTTHGLANASEMQTHFLRRVASIAKSRGKRVVGWDEILQPGLPQDTVIQSWRGPQALAEAARAHHPSLFSFGYYLNLPTPLRDVYEHDALTVPDGPSLSDAQILGGEACMWTEMVGPQNLERALWPRTIAVAERLWAQQSATSFEAFAARLPAATARLRHLGVDGPASAQAQLTALLPHAAAARLTRLLDYLEPNGENWWAGFDQRRPLTRLMDMASPSPRSEHEAWDAVQVLLEHRQHDLLRSAVPSAAADELPLWSRDVEQQATLAQLTHDELTERFAAMLMAANASADAVLAMPTLPPGGPGDPAAAQALWAEAQQAATLLKRQAAAFSHALARPPFHVAVASEGSHPHAAAAVHALTGDEQNTLKQLGVGLAFTRAFGQLQGSP